MFNRRLMLGVSAAALLGSIVSAQGFLISEAHAETKTLRVAQTWIPNVEYAGLWIALDRGYFEQEELDVQYIPGGPNATPPEVVVASGNAEIGYANWLPFLDAVARGNDFVMLAATFPVSPLGILSLPGRPILEPQDLVGARILAQRAQERAVVDATFAMNNLSGDWEPVPTGFSPEPLLAGDGDGYTAFATNQAITLELMGLEPGKDFHYVSFDELGFTSSNGVLFTTREYLERERPTVVAFLRGLTRGWQDNEQDPAAAVELAVSDYGADLGLDPHQQLRQNETQIRLMRRRPDQPLLMLDREIMQGPMYEAARASGRENLPDIDRLADFSVMQSVHDSLGTDG